MLAALLASADVPFVTLAQSDMSNVETLREAVADTPAEWEALWKAHAPSAARPELDLSSRTVVAVFLGTRPSSGYKVEITSVASDQDGVVVRYVERKPGPDAMTAAVITAPCHIVSFRKQPGRIRFERVPDAA